MTDARQNPTTYTYTNMDQVQTRTDALQKGESRTYDLNGNLSTLTDRKGQLSQYTYDALDRPTQVLYADQSTTSFTYDAGNRATQIVDSVSGTITRTYDNLDRLKTETAPQGSISYTYDSASRRTSMTVTGQPTVNYTYDIANKLTQITQGSSIVVYAYDSAKRLSSVSLPNGIVRSYGYDGASRVTSLSYSLGPASLGNLTYTYDADGRRTNAGGSLASMNLPSVLSSATYNANNQLTQWGAVGLSYDLNGNMTSDGSNSFSWDARNRLFSMNSAGFAYDTAGRRTQNAAGKGFFYDGANAVQELSGSTVTANLLTGPGVDQAITRTDSSGSQTFLTDALGSTIGLADGSGAVQTKYSYGPFGLTTTSGQTSSNSFQYTGRENDGTGLYCYRARYYNPTLQRFISEDPLGFGGGDANLYAYVGNDPTTFRDPTGELAVGAVVGAVIGGISGGMGARLQGGSTSDVFFGTVAGALGGALVGAIDPSEGLLTTAALGGLAGLQGDIFGQAFGNRTRKCKSFNLGEAIGAGIGGATGAGMGGYYAMGVAGIGGSSLAQALMGGGIGAAPALVGGPIGQAIGPDLRTNRRYNCH